MRQEMMVFLDGSVIVLTKSKQFASCSGQITMPAPHHLIFTGQMLFLMPRQNCRSTEGTSMTDE